MKRKGIILTILVVVLQLCSVNIQARPTTRHEAEKIVKGWLKSSARPLDTDLGRQVGTIETYTDDDGKAVYYIVYLQPNGFVIVSADDLIEPIVGFVPEGMYDPSPTNPLGALVSGDLKGRIELIRAGRPARTKRVTGVSAEPEKKWKKFIGIAEAPGEDVGIMGLPNINDVRVAPLIQSRWHQKNCCSSPLRACYNYYTPGPPDGSGNGDPNNYYCGCVATALAQIMRYHKHPNTGIGVHSFNVLIRGASYSRNTRGGDGSGGAYNWDDMVFVPGCSTTEAQRQAIGALCYDAGVAISNRISGEYTSYNSDETTAYTHSAKLGLTNSTDGFKYGNAIFGYNGGSNIGDGLVGMVNPDLDAGLPVCFGIKRAGYSIGHQVVCDGYGYNAGTMYHHLNMGWAGAYDAWYDLPDINSTPWYDTVYETIYNIYKLGSGEVISGRVVDPSGNPISDANVNKANYPGPSPVSTHRTNAKGIYAFYGVTSDANISIWADKTGYVFGGSTIVHTGHSTDSQSTSGNLWGVDIICIAPDINTMTPTSGPPGTYMKIQGTNFGTSPGTVVFTGGYYGDEVQWSDTLIVCRNPCPYSGNVIVRTAVGVESTGVYFEVTNPSTIYVDVNHIPDIENGTTDYPFSTIERGIFPVAYTWIGNTVIVKPGIYNENINLSNEYIILTSTDPNDPNVVASTVIDGNSNGAAAVTFNYNCSVLTGFTITNGGAEFGGGIDCNGQCEEAAPTISRCVITRNMASAGGGIYCHDSSPTISHCIITGNGAMSRGGGISCENNNTWYYPTIDHCLLVGNGGYSGGGIYLEGGRPTISHCAISSNTSFCGGGIFCADANMLVYQTILWGDTGEGGPEIFITNTEEPSTIKYSDVQGGLEGAYYPPTNPPNWDANNIDADPMFLSDPNPGPDGNWDDVNDNFGDLHLLSDSPCIDTGDPNYVLGPNEKDIDDNPRIVGCRVDIGADEFVYLGDIDFDGNVDFPDFAVFAAYWQDIDCGLCGGVDLTGDGTVDFDDLAELAENWLKSLCSG